MAKTAPKTTPPPTHKILYTNVDAGVHRAIQHVAQALDLKLTTVAHAILGQALGQPTVHSRLVTKAVGQYRRGTWV
jgi:hypothetical protein